MVTLILLAIIYLAFVSLGLPDSILGVSFPAMQTEWGIELSVAGIISMFITGSTIISSFISGFVIKKFGTAKTIILSCILTGSALLGFSAAPAWYSLILLSIPLGLGGGSVDTALNNYVALNYKAHHMNWLHSFWGVGATIGPLLMSYKLEHASWRSGYFTIGLLQLTLALILLISLPLWKKAGHVEEAGKKKSHGEGPWKTLKLPGAAGAMLTMMFYCAAEVSTGLLGSSYLIRMKGLSIETAASWMAIYYGGITAGRLLSGFVSFRMSNTHLIRFGILTALSGVVMLSLPLPLPVSGFSIILIGIGFAPIFPSMLHETPARFGREHSQVLLGYQLGAAYSGCTFLPPLMGIIMQKTSMMIFPFILMFFTAAMLILTERLSGAISCKPRT